MLIKYRNRNDLKMMKYKLLLLMLVMLLEQSRAFEEEWQNHIVRFIEKVKICFLTLLPMHDDI